MSVNLYHRYPVSKELRDGSSVTLRPMSRADESALVEFFQTIPAEERFFLKDEVTSAAVIREWITELNYDRVVPLLAVVGHQVVGDAALLRHRSASMQHMAEVRVVIGPGYRERGLAVTMLEELIEIGREAGLDELVFEFAREVQEPAIQAAEFLGAKVAGTLPAWVRDAANKPHDIVFLRLPLKA